MQNGWALDHQAMAASDLTLLTTPDALIEKLCDRAGIGAPAAAPEAPARPGPRPPAP